MFRFCVLKLSFLIVLSLHFSMLNSMEDPAQGNLTQEIPSQQGPSAGPVQHYNDNELALIAYAREGDFDSLLGSDFVPYLTYELYEKLMLIALFYGHEEFIRGLLDKPKTDSDYFAYDQDSYYFFIHDSDDVENGNFSKIVQLLAAFGYKDFSNKLAFRLAAFAVDRWKKVGDLECLRDYFNKEDTEIMRLRLAGPLLCLGVMTDQRPINFITKMLDLILEEDDSIRFVRLAFIRAAHMDKIDETVLSELYCFIKRHYSGHEPQDVLDEALIIPTLNYNSHSISLLLQLGASPDRSINTVKTIAAMTEAIAIGEKHPLVPGSFMELFSGLLSEMLPSRLLSLLSHLSPALTFSEELLGLTTPTFAHFGAVSASESELNVQIVTALENIHQQRFEEIYTFLRLYRNMPSLSLRLSRLLNGIHVTSQLYFPTERYTA